MGFEDLRQLISGADAQPVAVDWEAVEEWLGTGLPRDYKDLADAWGPVDIGGCVHIAVPATAGDYEYASWLRRAHARIDTQHRTWDGYSGGREFWPAPGGLLACGWLGDTSKQFWDINVLFWDTSASAHPDEWPVVVFHGPGTYHRKPGPWCGHAPSLTAFLSMLFSSGVAMDPGRPPFRPNAATASRPARLADARPWAAPEPESVRLARRRAALTEGHGFDALTRLVPPPDEPRFGGGMTWDDLASAVGARLPGEYVTLMETYGAGCWNGWWRFMAPLDTGSGGVLEAASDCLDTYAEFREEFPDWYPLAVWPEPGGFFPFALSVDGDYLGWLTEGNPDKWPLIVAPRHSDQGPPLRHGLVDVLLAWSRGAFRDVGFPVNDGAEDPLEHSDFLARRG